MRPNSPRATCGESHETASKAFGPAWGAEQQALVRDVGGTTLVVLPPAHSLRHRGEGTDTGGGGDMPSGSGRNPITQVHGFATSYSLAHRIAFRSHVSGAFGLPV